MQRLQSELFNSSFKVKDVRASDKIVEGMAGITFVHYIMDWKSSTNASDKSADMVLKIITKLLCTFSHTLPRTWHQVKQLASPEDITKYRFERCLCQEHSFKPLPTGER